MTPHVEPGTSAGSGTSATPEFRCGLASLARQEPLIGSAPPEGDVVLLEYPGPWPAEAIRDGRLPDPVKEVLATRSSYVVRRHQRVPDGDGVRVFRWRAGVLTSATTTYDALPDLDLDALRPFAGRPVFVCTNGDRDRCCAEFGRPVARALSEVWPDDVWEINHLGGHRFAGTLLHLPTGVVLGRLEPGTAVAAVAALREGRMPMDWLRGRMGLPRAAQVAEWAVRTQTGLMGEGDVGVRSVDGDTVLVEAGGEPWEVVVRTTVSEPFFQSCSRDKLKPAERFEVVSAARQMEVP